MLEPGAYVSIWIAALAAYMVPACHAAATVTLSPSGFTVYDFVSGVNWLADTNLAATNRFGLPLCAGSGNQVCVNASGSMNYQSAAAWVSAMNAANYLGHSNWQLPTTPIVDNNCGKVGPQGNSFGFGCTASALGSLYYNALGLKAPNTAVPIPANTAAPFSNFQPYLYWSQTSAAAQGYATFSFASGFQGANTAPNFLYVLPMIPGKIAGTPVATSTALQVNPDGRTVYDPVANVTWLANANLAATNTFGLPPCKDPTTPASCVNADGAMTWDSASQFILNMNGAGYLGQKNWELAPIDSTCNGYNCNGAGNPMGALYYNQLNLTRGTPVGAVPNVIVGPFHNIQPYLYWACQAATIQGACQTDGPAPNFEWSFSFGNGFEGTDLQANDLYATAYYVGPANSATGTVIAEVANAEGENPTIAPNTWVEIKGAGLAPPGDSRIWQASDFVGGQMPTQLDHVSASVNGKSAYIYYISPTQVNILTPPDAISGPLQVTVTNNGAASVAFNAQAQALSPSFFVFNGGPYVAAVHTNGTLIGPTTLYPGASTPAQPGEIVMIYANGFGPTIPSGVLSPTPVIKIGGITANVQFAGLVAAGQYQFNVVIPPALGNGDQAITATYSEVSTQARAAITVHN